MSTNCSPSHDPHVSELFEGEVFRPLAQARWKFGLFIEDPVSGRVQLEHDLLTPEKGQVRVLGYHKVGDL